MYGPFDMQMVPSTRDIIPTLDELRAGYGNVLPAYDIVTNRLPAGVRVRSGKKGTNDRDWYTCAVLALGAVYWDGMGGPNFFRQKITQGGMVANWALSDEETLHSVPVTTVYEDPTFASTAKTKTFDESERLIDPREAPKVQEPGGGKRNHKYECSQAPQQTHSSTRGRWWPVWLVCRTKK